MNITLTADRKKRITSFLIRHALLLISLDIMTLGVVLCVKSNLGSSVISSLPYVLSLAGPGGAVPQWTIGGYTVAMNFALVFCQILVLRRRFDPMQLFQLVIGFVFGWLIDLNMYLTSGLDCASGASQLLAQLGGCTIMGLGIAAEVKCGSVTMPGEGITIALGQVSGRPFAKIKILVDIALVLLAICAGYMFFGRWMCNVIGPGTLFAMIYVGMVVKLAAPRLGIIDRILEGDAYSLTGRTP